MTRLRPTRRVALALTLALGCETRLLLVESPSDSDAVADVGGATGDGAAQDGDSFGGAAGSGSGIPPRCVATCAANEACVDDDCVVVQRDPELAAGISATCVRRGSALHCWGGGNGRSVVLGTGDGIEHLTPVRVGSQILWSEVSTSAGELFCGRSVDGQGRCWGGNSSGQLGVGDGEERAIPTLIDDFRFTRVRGGSGHSCGLDAERRAYCWGRNLDGDLGIGTTDSAATPRRVQLEAVLADLAVGWGHSCAVDVSGKLYCWGRNLEGQLGVGSTTNSSRPFQVGSRDDYIRVQLGGRHSCALTRDRELYCWGENFDGAVGDGTDENRTEPVPVALPDSVLDFGVGVFSACAVTNSGSLWCWGDLFADDPYTPGPSDLLTPTLMDFDLSFSSIALGYDSLCAVNSSSDIYCWGNNAHGQLGQGDLQRRTTPARVVFP